MTPAKTPEAKRFKIGIDVGGTFTDLSIVEDTESGPSLSFHKALSTPDDPSVGVFDALNVAAQERGISREALLSQTRFLGLGTTVATNIMVQRQGADVALVATRGFRDALSIRRGIREDVWDIRRPHPKELVPRWNRFTIEERVDSKGNVLLTPRADELDRLAEEIKAADVEAIAICLFNSFLNHENETMVADYLRRVFPNHFISVSTELIPRIGEYERTSTTVINAFVGPKTARYLIQLVTALREAGLQQEPLIMQSNGGLVGVAPLLTAPVRAVLSGPAAGGSAAASWAEISGADDVVFFDMGGTSIDILVTEQKNANHKDVTAIEGYHMVVPSIDIRTVGTGGGTIARVDPGGLLRVGPDSAGSVPGPASYGRGGIQPTVTDANLVLGRLSGDQFMAGKMPLDMHLARQAIDVGIAKKQGVSVEQSALDIIRIANENMAASLRIVAAEGGLDLRKYMLVSAGGAAGMHVSAIRRMLGMAGVYIPLQASVACSVGMLLSDIQRDQVISIVRPISEIEPEELQERLETEAGQASAELLESGCTTDKISHRCSVELRYVGQVWNISVPLDLPVTQSALDAATVRFHDRHKKLYHHDHRDQSVELVNIQFVTVGNTDKIEWREITSVKDVKPTRGERPVWFAWSDTPVDTKVFDGTTLQPGDSIEGPAVIEEKTTSVLLDRGDLARVDSFGNYVVTVKEK